MKDRIFNYVMANAKTKQRQVEKWVASITLCGYDFSEERTTEDAAKEMLAIELSNSKFIQANFKE